MNSLLCVRPHWQRRIFATRIRRLGLMVVGVLCSLTSLVGAWQPAGSVDAAFNPPLDRMGEIKAVAIQRDGKAVVSGAFTAAGGTDASCLLRLNADGSPDTGFSPRLGVDAAARGMALAMQNDGKIIIAGSFIVANETTSRCLARLNADGSLDASFNPGLGTDIEVSALALQDDGKLLVGCRSNGNARAVRPFVARLNADGSLDAGFHPDPTKTGEEIHALALQRDGKALIAGRTVARLNADGSVDASFAAAETDGSGQINALAAPDDGKIILGGSFDHINETPRNGLARLRADGSLDASFHPKLEERNDDFTVKALIVQHDGKMLVGGDFTRVNQVRRPYIARLNANGSLDKTFVPGSGPDCGVAALAVQGDGDVLMAGDFSTVSGKWRNGLARLLGAAGRRSPLSSGASTVGEANQADVNGILARVYRSTDDFASALESFTPSKTRGRLARFFSAVDETSANDSDAGRARSPERVEDIALLWRGEDHALFFAVAHPPTELHCAKAVLFALRQTKAGWRVSDARAYVAYGKYAGFECKLTAESDRERRIGDDSATITLTKSEGGRGLSIATSLSLKLENHVLARTF